MTTGYKSIMGCFYVPTRIEKNKYEKILISNYLDIN
jgi:hypothetical protein